MTKKSSKLLIEALENERRYAAKKLHDGVAQTAQQLGLQIGICQKLLERNKLDMLGPELDQIEEKIEIVSSQVRDLIQDLRPPAIEEEASLEEHIRYVLKVHEERGGAPVTYQHQMPEAALEFTRSDIIGIARIVQAGLINVCQPDAGEKISVTVAASQDQLRIIIAGKEADEPASESTKEDISLIDLRLRVLAMGGTLTLGSETEECVGKIGAALPL